MVTVCAVVSELEDVESWLAFLLEERPEEDVLSVEEVEV
jgi:hypothetical protein